MKNNETKILLLDANPKSKSTASGILKYFSYELSRRGIDSETINLAQHRIEECIGCMECIRTGNCTIKDDMGNLIRKMREADGYIVGSSIRDNSTTALFKKFCERTSYLLGFTKDLLGKPAVGVATVGYIGGRRQARDLLTMKNYGTKRAGFIYEKVGFQKEIRNPERLRSKVKKIATSFINEVDKTKMLGNRLKPGDLFFKIFIVSTKEHLPYIYSVWRDKGWAR